MQEKQEIKLGTALKEAWNIFLKAPEVFVVLTFVAFAMSLLRPYIPAVGQIVSVVVFSLYPGAIFLVAEAAQGRERVSFAALEPLPNIAPQLVMLGVTRLLFVSIGIFCLVLPGLYAILAFIFADLFVVLQRRNFWESMKQSHNLVRTNWLGIIGLLFFLVAFVFSGLLLLGLGILATAPLASLTLYSVFKRINDQPTEPVVVA